MQIEFKSIHIEDFKGIGNRDVEFSQGVTVLSGPNRSGKTTILDAVYWVLFGKTLTGDTRFGILPLDKQSGVPSVSLELTVDGENHTLTRKWVNSATLCLIDNAPKQLKEYNLWVDTNLMPIERFKVFSNPVHFASLPTKEQRDLFMRFFKKPKPEEIRKAMDRDGVVLSPDYYERSLKNSAQEIIDQVKGRGNVQGELVILEKKQAADVAVADHLTRDMQANPSRPAEELEAEREKILGKMALIEEDMAAKSQHRAERYEWIRNQHDEINYTQGAIDLETAKLKRAREDAAAEYMAVCARHTNKIGNLRDEWERLSKQKTPEACPTCKRPFPAEDVEAAKEAQAKRLKEIEDEGSKLKAEVSKASKEAEKIRSTPLVKNAHLTALEATIKELEKKLDERLDEEVPAPPADGYDDMRRRLDEITAALGNNAAYERNEKQLAEIKQRMDGTARQIQMLNRLLQDAGQWIRYEAMITVEQVNNQFEHVRIELFDYLKDGTPKETFALTMDGKDYGDLSSTERIMVGLEINRYLKDALDVSVPTIIDNFESYGSIGIEGLTPQAIVAVATDDKDGELIAEPYEMEG